MDHAHIVKRKGHKESYDNHKVYASCYAACLNTHMSKERAEEICFQVTRAIDDWIAGKESVSSQEIFDEVALVMGKHNTDASFMYKSHRDIS